MISNFYQNNRFTTLFVLAVASGLVISLLLSLQPTNAIQSVNQSPQSTIPPAKLTYTSLGGDLKGSIEGLLVISGYCWVSLVDRFRVKLLAPRLM